MMDEMPGMPAAFRRPLATPPVSPPPPQKAMPLAAAACPRHVTPPPFARALPLLPSPAVEASRHAPFYARSAARACSPAFAAMLLLLLLPRAQPLPQLRFVFTLLACAARREQRQPPPPPPPDGLREGGWMER